MFFLQQDVKNQVSVYWKPVMFVLLLTLWLFSIVDGHDWGGDFSQYLHHAINLASGKDYADIGYIHNIFAFVGPSTYPPIFSFALASVYALFGFNLFAFKAFIVVCFFSALYLSTVMFKDKLSNLYQFVFIAVLALNPYLWFQKNHILSDYLFMVVVFITFVVLNKRYIQTSTGYTDTKSKAWSYAVLIGVLLYMNYATREIGVVFIPAIIVFELFHFRKITIATMMALIVFAGLTALQNKVMSPPPYNAERVERVTKLSVAQGEQSAQVNHADFVKLDLALMTKQGIRYLKSLRELWPENSSLFVQFASWTVLLLFFIFTLAGYVLSVIKGPSLIDIFVAGYIAVLLLFAGAQGLRYLMPLVPVFFWYAFRVHEVLTRSKYQKSMIVIAVVFITSTITSYASSTSYSKDLSLGITNPNAVSFFDYVRTSTPKESIFLFQKPRVLSLLTQRQASGVPGGRGTKFIVDYMDAIGADYIALSAIDAKGFSHPVSALTPPQDKLALVFKNEHFYVYKRIFK